MEPRSKCALSLFEKLAVSESAVLFEHAPLNSPWTSCCSSSRKVTCRVSLSPCDCFRGGLGERSGDSGERPVDACESLGDIGERLGPGRDASA
mmetsp:Transcript_5887/g.11506  ORF Transcript_5887/g.11506 Transcript_5887/m.11506 type:complete len:93 (-) Transcript_5887:20-298(-)